MTLRVRDITIFSLLILFMCAAVVVSIKLIFFKDVSFFEPIRIITNTNHKSKNNEEKNKNKVLETIENEFVKEEFELEPLAPVTPEVDIVSSDAGIQDDGSIIFDGLTLTELADKLNRSLNSNLSNTGIYFAEYTKKTGLDPYLAVAIVLLETGCTWNCSYITVQCNNIGGLKGHGSCDGSSYSKYDSLEEGIISYLDIVYNGYYLKGLTTPELMNPKYAESPEWARKVNNYIEKIKAA